MAVKDVGVVSQGAGWALAALGAGALGFGVERLQGATPPARVTAPASSFLRVRAERQAIQP